MLSLKSLLFLAYLLVFLPLMAFRSRNQLVPASEESSAASSSLKAVWFWTIFGHSVLFIVAWLAAEEVQLKLFSKPTFALVDWLYACAALSACIVISFFVRSDQTNRQSESRAMAHLLLPRSKGETTLKNLTVLSASVAEEFAYRGVGFFIVGHLFGNLWLAAVVCSVAFGLAHWAQGWKSVFGITGIGMVLQALVAVTNTLFLAIVVHAVFDIVAFYRNKREAREIAVQVSAT